MSCSGSVSSLDSLGDRYPLLKGVHPPAVQTMAGLTDSGDIGPAPEDLGSNPPSGSDAQPIIIPATREAADTVGGNGVAGSLLGISMEIVASAAGTGDNMKAACRPLWLNLLLQPLLVLSTATLILSYQIWITDANSHHYNHKQLTDAYTLLLFASFWPAVFFWLCTYILELVIQKTCNFLPGVSFWQLLLTAALSGLWVLIFLFSTAEQRVPRNTQGVLAISMVIFTLVFRCTLLKRGIVFSAFWKNTICIGRVNHEQFSSFLPF